MLKKDPEIQLKFVIDTMMIVSSKMVFWLLIVSLGKSEFLVFVWGRIQSLTSVLKNE